jgi:sortase (surface protein transpeptidase)
VLGVLLVGLAGGVLACGQPPVDPPTPTVSAESVTASPSPSAAPQTSAQPSASPPPVVVAMAESKPVRITIPKINAESSLIPLGLAADGTLAVPPVSKPLQAGWFTGGPTPGEDGPAVIVGHVDGVKRPGIFYRLRELAVGDAVAVARADGTTAKFVVSDKQQVAKSRFPTDRVYDETPGPELRLITCGGAFDRPTRNYLDNLIIYAKLAP